MSDPVDEINLSSDDDDVVVNSVDESIILLTSDDDDEPKEQKPVSTTATEKIIQQILEIASTVTEAAATPICQDSTSPPAKKLKGLGDSTSSSTVIPIKTVNNAYYSLIPGQTLTARKSTSGVVGRKVSRMSTAGSPRVNQHVTSMRRMFANTNISQEQQPPPESDDDDSSSSSSSSSCDNYSSSESSPPSPSNRREKDTDDKGFECYDLDDYDGYYTKDLLITDMVCDVCEKAFKRLGLFRFHHRRHEQLDHFKCPTCLRGFRTLTLCCLHEMKEHNEMTEQDLKYAKKCGADAAAAGYENGYSHDDGNSSSSFKPVPSTCLEQYRGPPVSSSRNAFGIEEKFAKGRAVAKEIERSRKKYQIHS